MEEEKPGQRGKIGKEKKGKGCRVVGAYKVGPPQRR